MSYLLHIDTATEVCSVCLTKDHELCSIRESTESYAHSRLITVFIEACIKEAGIQYADLDGVCVSKGPGSYTGLRVGVSAAKGICYALDIPLISVDTLTSLALAGYRNLCEEALYCPMIDARRMEVYTGLYGVNGVPLMHNQAMILDDSSFSSLFNVGEKIVFCGNGSSKYKEIADRNHSQFIEIQNSAKHLIPLGMKKFASNVSEDINLFEPEYIKAPNITKSTKNQLNTV